MPVWCLHQCYNLPMAKLSIDRDQDHTVFRYSSLQGTETQYEALFTCLSASAAATKNLSCFLVMQALIRIEYLVGEDCCPTTCLCNAYIYNRCNYLAGLKNEPTVWNHHVASILCLFRWIEKVAIDNFCYSARAFVRCVPRSSLQFRYISISSRARSTTCKPPMAAPQLSSSVHLQYYSLMKICIGQCPKKRRMENFWSSLK